METRVVTMTTATIAAAGEILRSGGLVAFPTETVYGLGANGLDAAACAGIYAAKGRPSDNPLILHVADRAMVDAVASSVPPLAEKLFVAFCPGPITLILPKRDEVPDMVTGGLSTVGVRMPDHDVARALIRAAGVPIAAPSANLSGRPSPTTAAAVAHDMAGRIPMIVDGGACPFGVESTIVDCTGAVATILRPGAITREMIAEVCGEVALDPALVGAATVPRAPGMKYTHYAPRAPLTLIEMVEDARDACVSCGVRDVDDMRDACAMDDNRDAHAKGIARMRAEVLARQKRGEVVGLVVSAETAAALSDLVPREYVAVLGVRADLQAIAARLYEALRRFDDTSVTSLLGETFPAEGLGLAIMNRLGKACGGRILCT